MASAAMLAFAAVNSTSALAVTAGWMLNGTMLTAEGLTSAAIATEATIDSTVTLSDEVENVECSGRVLLDNASIRVVNDILIGRVLFGGCATETKNCEVGESQGVGPLLIEFTLDGVLHAKGLVRPETGTVLSTIKFSGELCAVSGVKALTGAYEVLIDEGQDERTDQLWLYKQTANGLLKLGSSPASYVGAVLVLLANSRPWSFL
jgi:hypothetical protein